ncbi:hypothetical protein BGX33_003815 [Mortierella sp. NVP41]|nr:hypothetical protein BGX33_003815 [Mortierella sp. NVP41]
MPLNHKDRFVVNAADPSASRRQVIEFKLSEEALEEILNGNESIRLDLNQTLTEVYKLPAGTKQLDLVGNITAKCTVQKTHVKQGQKKATRHEHPRTIIDPKDLKSKSASGRRGQSPSPSTTTVPAATAAAAAAAAAASGTMVPLRTRVVQLVAQQPRGTEEKELMRMLRVGREDLQSILPFVANYSGGRYVLKPETYKEVKIYDWKSYSAKQREVVIKNAREAFDLLGLSLDAPERDILRPEMIKRTSPLRVAEGDHTGHMDATGSKRRSGGGGAGSESEGFENGRIHHTSGTGGSSLKPPSTQKRTSAKKSPGTTTSSSLSSKNKNGPKSTGSSSTTKASRREKAAAAAAIMDAVPNHSARGPSTPSSSLKPPTLTGTPGMGGSPVIAGRRTSINGNGLPSVPRRGSEAKKTGGTSNRDTGGVGNGYKIPKVGSGTTIPRKPQSPSFTVPPITTQAEYEEISRQFKAKYQDMISLRAQIDKKKELFDQLGAELEHAVGTDRELELKRKVQEAFGEDVVDRKVLRRTGEARNGVSARRAAEAIAEQNNHLSLRSMVDRYKTLHNEVDTMKRALCEAGAAQAERTGQPEHGSGGGGTG